MALIPTIIIDDHALIRLAVRTLLEKEQFTIVAESDDGIEAQHLVDLYQPDVVIIDIDIARLDGLEVIKRLRRCHYSGVIIVLSAKNPDFYAPLSASAGANGFVSKDDTLSEVITAIHAGIKGYSYFPLVQRKIIDGADLTDQQKIETLSSQEFKVFQLLLNGLQNAEVALKMNLSAKTVATYKCRLMEKLNFKTIKQLYEFGQRNCL
ncbi:response regulator [Pantoea sp.]|uniref:response regulator n=1 Tax=Pantoea sp. TaxID=69393 RepID=UPI0031DB8AF5